jgi:ABC-2 type transport system permease protein
MIFACTQPRWKICICTTRLKVFLKLNTPGRNMINPLVPQRLHLQLLDLVLIQLSNWRWAWRGMVVTGIMGPTFSILAFGLFARGSDSVTLGYILTGGMVLNLMFTNQDKVCNNFAFMRAVGMLNYFAALPVQRYSLVLATVLAFLLLSLPSLAITTLVGILFLHVQLMPSPLVLLVVPLAAIPLAGIGALIGTTARTPEEAGSISMILTFIMTGLGPVVFPPDRLPEILLKLGWLSPATYAASALRQTLLGPITPRLALDLIVLLGLASVALWIVSRKMDWRNTG